jgi:hypothetical protein
LSTKVASIIAEIGIDTNKFKAGINSFGNSLNTSLGKLGGFGKGVNDITRQLTGFDITTVGAAAAIGFLAKETVEAVKETQAYNLAMTDLALKMGTTTEEASRLVQVGDDIRLSQEQISTAMTYAIRNGVEPNIEGLAKLSDKYNSLQTPVERGQLLLKTFGRSGMDMAKLMEQGGDKIRTMSAAIDDNLIVTAKVAEASKKWYEAQDKLNDQMTGIKMQVGNEVIPTLTKLADIQTKYGEIRSRDAASIKTDIIPIYGQLANTWRLAEATFQAFTGGIEDSGSSIIDTTDKIVLFGRASVDAGITAEESMEKAARAAEEAADKMTRANEKTLREIEQWGNIEGNFTDDMANLYDERTKLVDEFNALVDDGTDEYRKNYEEHRIAIEKNNKAIQDNVAEHEIATKKIILGYVEQNLARDGLTERETEALINLGVQWGIYSEDAVAAFRAGMDQANQMTDTINNIPTEHRTNIYIDTYHQSYGGGHEDENNGRLGGYASGGVTHGEWAWVGEQGPEKVRLPSGSRVYNNNESRNMDNADTKELIAAFERYANTNKIDYNKMARVFVDTLAGTGA